MSETEAKRRYCSKECLAAIWVPASPKGRRRAHWAIEYDWGDEWDPPVCPRCGRVLLDGGETLPMATREMVAEAGRYRTLVAIMERHGGVRMEVETGPSDTWRAMVHGLYERKAARLSYGFARTTMPSDKPPVKALADAAVDDAAVALSEPDAPLPGADD